jgi:hypothetical protein
MDEKVTYRVVKEISNGGKIAGARRAQGATFEAHPSSVMYAELEGVIERVAPKPAKKPAAPQD